MTYISHYVSLYFDVLIYPLDWVSTFTGYTSYSQMQIALEAAFWQPVYIVMAKYNYIYWFLDVVFHAAFNV